MDLADSIQILSRYYPVDTIRWIVTGFQWRSKALSKRSGSTFGSHSEAAFHSAAHTHEKPMRSSHDRPIAITMRGEQCLIIPDDLNQPDREQVRLQLRALRQLQQLFDS